MNNRFRLARLFLSLVLSWHGLAHSSWLMGEQAPSLEFAQACRTHLPPTSVQVRGLIAPLRFDYSLSVKQITRRAQDGTAGHAHATQKRVLGLTEAKYSYQADVGGQMLTDSVSGLSCIRPRISMTVSAGAQLLLVASDFPRGTCWHNAISEHEMLHAQVNDRMARYVAGITQEGMTRYFGQRIIYGSKAQLSKKILELVENEWFAWASSQMRAAERMHEQIDSPEQIERYQNICRDDIHMRAVRLQ